MLWYFNYMCTSKQVVHYPFNIGFNPNGGDTGREQLMHESFLNTVVLLFPYIRAPLSGTVCSCCVISNDYHKNYSGIPFHTALCNTLTVFLSADGKHFRLCKMYWQNGFLKGQHHISSHYFLYCAEIIFYYAVANWYGTNSKNRKLL